jgi:hypothetical protein
VFHSELMVGVVNDMVNYFLPSTASKDFLTVNLYLAASRHGVQAFSLVMILVACTGIFLPLEVALNQAWGVTKSRNYLHNQVIAFGLAILMLVLGMGSILVNAAARDVLTLVFVHRRGLDPVLLFHLLAAAQPEGTVAAGSAHVDLYRNHLAGSEVYLYGRASAPGSEGALRAVLCVGGAAVLGLCLRADSVCRGTVQRGAVGAEKWTCGLGKLDSRRELSERTSNLSCGSRL